MKLGGRRLTGVGSGEKGDRNSMQRICAIFQGFLLSKETRVKGKEKPREVFTLFLKMEEMLMEWYRAEGNVG